MIIIFITNLNTYQMNYFDVFNVKKIQEVMSKNCYKGKFLKR